MPVRFVPPVLQEVFARATFYPTLLKNILSLGGERRWYDRLNERVILGALPLRKYNKELVDHENVKLVVSLCNSYEMRFFVNSETEWNRLGVKQVHIPVMEYFGAPTVPQMEYAVNAINELEDGASAYVHCKAGRSRSATVAASFIINATGYMPDQALYTIKRKRPHITLTSVQMHSLYSYYNDLHQQ